MEAIVPFRFDSKIPNKRPKTAIKKAEKRYLGNIFSYDAVSKIFCHGVTGQVRPFVNHVQSVIRF